MSNTEPTVRQQYHFPASLARRVEDLAEIEGVTKSELVRRAVCAYEPGSAADEAEVAAFLAEVRAAVTMTIERVDRLRAAIHELADPAARETERTRLREMIRARLMENPEEIDALADWLEGA